MSKPRPEVGLSRLQRRQRRRVPGAAAPRRGQPRPISLLGRDTLLSIQLRVSAMLSGHHSQAEVRLVHPPKWVGSVELEWLRTDPAFAPLLFGLKAAPSPSPSPNAITSPNPGPHPHPHPSTHPAPDPTLALTPTPDFCPSPSPSPSPDPNPDPNPNPNKDPNPDPNPNPIPPRPQGGATPPHWRDGLRLPRAHARRAVL